MLCLEAKFIKFNFYYHEKREERKFEDGFCRGEANIAETFFLPSLLTFLVHLSKVKSFLVKSCYLCPNFSHM